MLQTSYPRQVILISSRLDNKDNIMTVSWHMPVSFKPELYAFSISKKRHTFELIEQSNVFAINFISKDQEQIAVDVGTHSGFRKNKFEMFKIDKEECERIDCPVMKDAVAVLECKVVNNIEAGDHVIIIGEVLNRKINTKERRLFQSGTGDRFTTTVEKP
ncbi:MAG: flavin reductase family protein [Nanoarchaeota archaeon]|nr:flavin reductase family protein [Nanoarchaeota archaeon]